MGNVANLPKIWKCDICKTKNEINHQKCKKCQKEMIIIRVNQDFMKPQFDPFSLCLVYSPEISINYLLKKITKKINEKLKPEIHIIRCIRNSSFIGGHRHVINSDWNDVISQPITRYTVQDITFLQCL